MTELCTVLLTTILIFVPKITESRPSDLAEITEERFRQLIDEEFSKNTIDPTDIENGHIISYSKELSGVHFDQLMGVIEETTNTEMSRSFDDFTKMAFWATVLSLEDGGHDFTAIHEINFEDAKQWWKDSFTDYGCYCWPNHTTLVEEGDDHGSQKIHGFSQPVDELDHECFDLYNCYRCVSMMPECREVDWVNTHYDCEFITVNNPGEDRKLSITCNDQDPCKQSLCECDKKFAINSKERLLTKNDFYKDIFHQGGCPRVPEYETERKKCCGSWPDVAPYNTYDDAQCCHDKQIFNDSSGVCDATDEENNQSPHSWTDFYGGESQLILNVNKTDTHDHTADHSSADHFHMHIGKK